MRKDGIEKLRFRYPTPPKCLTSCPFKSREIDGLHLRGGVHLKKKHRLFAIFLFIFIRFLLIFVNFLIDNWLKYINEMRCNIIFDCSV